MTVKHIHGAINEVAPQILPWVEKNMRREQRCAKKRIINLRRAEQMVEDLLRSEKPYGVYFDWGGGLDSRRFYSRTRTSVFIGAFYRVGSRAHVGLGVGRIWVGAGEEEKDALHCGYYWLTRTRDGHGWLPPKDEELLARALANPRRVSAMERLDVRRYNAQQLAGRVNRSMARIIIKALGFHEMFPFELKVWKQGNETFVMYRHGLKYLCFFENGEIYRLNSAAGALAQQFLDKEKKRWGLTEAARLAVVMGSLEVNTSQ